MTFAKKNNQMVKNKIQLRFNGSVLSFDTATLSQILLYTTGSDIW